VTGAGAKAWLNGLVTGFIPKPGRIGLVYFADERGRILTEMSVIALEEDNYMLITAATAEVHDFEVLSRSDKPDTVELSNVTDDFNTLIVSGPKSREVLAAAGFEADLTQGWLTHQTAKVDGHPCQLIRVSFAGELGWEVHTHGAEASQAAYEAVVAAGAKPFGMFALNSMRIEKGYRAWKGDLSTDYSLLEGGLERFVKLNKQADFVGKTALANELQQGAKKGFVTLVVEGGDFDAPYMSTIWQGDQVVGEVTSSAYGYRSEQHIALGVVKKGLDAAGTKLEVEIFGTRHAAIVQDGQSVWDPENTRLRA